MLKSNVACFTTHVQTCLVTKLIRLLQVAWILISDWIKLRGSHAIHGSYVTCSKTSLPWAGKTRNMYRFCRKKKNYSLLSATNLCNLQQADLLQDRFECGRYINTSLFDLFCTNVSKQDAHFCCRFYHPLVSRLVPENILTSPWRVFQGFSGVGRGS